MIFLQQIMVEITNELKYWFSFYKDYEVYKPPTNLIKEKSQKCSDSKNDKGKKNTEQEVN